MKRLVLELDDEFHQIVKESCLKSKQSMRQTLLQLLEKWVAKENHGREQGRVLKTRTQVRTAGSL